MGRLLLMLLVLSILTSIAISKEKQSADVIIIGAGIAGITAAKLLIESGVTDVIILEATGMIGGRMRKQSFGGFEVEIGANWVEGVGGKTENPIWALAKQANLTVFLSDDSTVTQNTYNSSGLVSEDEAAPAWDKSDAAAEFADTLGQKYSERGRPDISVLVSQRLNLSTPVTPLDMVADYFYTDWEFAEPPRITSLKYTHPNPTFEVYGPDSYFVADSRGFATVVHVLAQSVLESVPGCCGQRNITDSRLKLNKVVTRILYNVRGGRVYTSDKSVYSARHIILTVSAGVLQSESIDFKPDLPTWKLEALFKFNMAIFTKIFLKFPYVFWPSGGPGTEFFVYADEKRGYYPVWKHFENQYPGSAILMVVVTDDESRRIEQQTNEETLSEVMAVLRSMFGSHIPTATEIFVPRWWKNPFFRGTYSNWPIGVDHHHFVLMQRPLGRLYFSGEHTSESFNGYVHGGFESGERVAHEVLACINGTRCSKHSQKEPHVRLEGGDAIDGYP